MFGIETDEQTDRWTGGKAKLVMWLWSQISPDPNRLSFLYIL